MSSPSTVAPLIRLAELIDSDVVKIERMDVLVLIAKVVVAIGDEMADDRKTLRELTKRIERTEYVVAKLVEKNDRDEENST